MTTFEELPNPDRPGSYKEYVSEKGAVLQAEDIFHYFNHDLSLASFDLQSIRRTVDRLAISPEEKHSLLNLLADIDKKHGDLQMIALDAIRLLAGLQRQ